jgi:ribonuclease J
VRLRIHHGAAEIGGNCIEVEAQGRALLLDLGLPLDRPPRLPDVAGLDIDDGRLLGVVLSHPHLDHYGLLPLVRPTLPVWIGEQAKRLLEAAAPFTRGAFFPQPTYGYRTAAPFSIGPFTITPFLVDHSAYDAHALLVEAEGKRVFYTGDFRGHGRKAATFERFLACPPSGVDVMLMEGTSLGREREQGTEQDVEQKAAAIMRETEGAVLACFSAQNIDRFVSFFRACIAAGRTFVIDAYMANLITALGMASLPDPADSRHLRVFLPKAQKRMILAGQRFDLIDRYRSRRIYIDELASRPRRFATLFRASMIMDLASARLAGGALIYSLWPGYLERDRTDLRAWAGGAGMSFHLVHSSGHAHQMDLARMAASVQPKRLIPIHTEHPERYLPLYGRVDPIANGVWTVV